MKLYIKRVLLGFLFVATVLALVPHYSISKDKPDTIALNDDNLVTLNTEINSDSVAHIIARLRTLDSNTTLWNKNKPIYLFLYSPGGDIQAGLELIEAVNGMHRPVHTVTLFGASMAFQLIENMGDRLVLKNGVLMSHRAAGQFTGYFGGQAPAQLDNRYALWLQRINELDLITVKRTKGKQTLESYRKQYADEMWLSGEQAVQQGYADAIVTVSCDKSLDGTDSHDINYLGIPVHYETSKCPLITGLLNIKVGERDNEGKLLDPLVIETVKEKFITSSNFTQKNIR